MPRLKWKRSDVHVVVESDVVRKVLRDVHERTLFYENREPASLPRVTLDIRGSDLHAMPWEEIIRGNMPRGFSGSIVRVSRVVPRVAQVAFTTPLRILLVGAAGAVRREIESLLGEEDPALVAEAVAVESADDIEKRHSWPVVDIVHLPSLPPAGDAEKLFSPSLKRRGSLGWLARLLDEWQTRLLIIDSLPSDQARLWMAEHDDIENARRFAAALVARGGPAVIVRHAHPSPLRLYERILRDFPLDAIEAGGIDSLFAGAGREELVRVSNAGEILEQLEPTPGGLLSHALRSFAGKYQNFDFLEARTGLLPMAGALSYVREVDSRWRFDAQTDGPSPIRHINGSLWREGKRVHDRERLRIGADHELRIQIAGEDEQFRFHGSSVFHEIPKVRPWQRGVWVEVAVNGIGFDIEGDPVQQLWVPFDAPSDVVTFCVRPKRSGACVLRYTLYYQQSVLQSFRIAALATDAAEPAPLAAGDARALADALDLPPHAIEMTTWMARLEYAATAITGSAAQHERDVSIVANDVAGRRVITVKGEEFFTDTDAGDISELVSDVRQTLFRSSLDPDHSDLCRFGLTADVNAQSFEEALPALARAGWLLYDRVLDFRARERVERTLKGEARTIAVAHTNLEKVIPWAIVYDRMFKEPDSGKAEVCTASLPDARGRLPATECGALAGCPLKNGTDPKHVACALRFWGFRHLIEVPPKQADGPGSTSVPTPAGTLSTGPPHLAAVINPSILNAPTHESAAPEIDAQGDARHVGGGEGSGKGHQSAGSHRPGRRLSLLPRAGRRGRSAHQTALHRIHGRRQNSTHHRRRARFRSVAGEAARDRQRLLDRSVQQRCARAVRAQVHARPPGRRRPRHRDSGARGPRRRSRGTVSDALSRRRAGRFRAAGCAPVAAREEESPRPRLHAVRLFRAHASGRVKAIMRALSWVSSFS